MKLLSLLFLLTVLVHPICALELSHDSNRKKMLNDLHSIKNTFEVKYAPSEWKQHFTNWNLDEQINLAREKIEAASPITIKDYQHIMREFFNSTKDYHVRVTFYSTEVALLPLRIQSAEGRYFITWKARWTGKKMTGAEEIFGKMPFEVGDEVLAFDNKPVAEAVEEFQMQEYGNPGSDTDKALAENALTNRLGSMGQKVPQGPISITVKHKGTEQIETYTLQWLYQPELISDYAAQTSKARNLFAVNAAAKQAKGKAKTGLEQHAYFKKQMSTPIFEQLKSARPAIKKMLAKNNLLGRDEEEEELGFEQLAAKKSFIPSLGPIIWQAPEDYPLHAYIFLTPDQRPIGYIRIPTFQSGEEQARIFALIVKEFQQSTEALIIDQVNNPGGSPFFMYGLASMLTDQPLKTPTERITITQEDIATALDFLDEDAGYKKEGYNPYIGESLYGYFINNEEWQKIVDHFEFLVQEWNQGRTFTNPAHFFGLDVIYPNQRVHYTKPIIILVNQLDFSCADFFPAILQDNKRALIFGSKTAGAGGFVLEAKFHNMLGMSKFWFTGSIAERPDGNPIENLGVVPDVEYQITADDLSNGYKGYCEALLETVSNLIESKFPA